MSADVTCGDEGAVDGMPVVRVCERRDIPAVADMLAGVFENDAAYRYLLSDAVTRRQGLREFFARNLAVHLSHRCTRVMVDDSGRVMATVTLRPPTGIHISPLTMIRHGLLPFALEHGMGAVKRMFWLKDTYDALEHEAAQGQPHWYVHMMAVAPDAQGRGLGGSLLSTVLTEASSPDESAPTVLTTHREINVTFYRRAGFVVLDQRTLTPPHADPYPVWSMVRRTT